MITYTITIEDDEGRRSTMKTTTEYPVKTINVEAVNELNKPKADEDYWTEFKKVLVKS